MRAKGRSEIVWRRRQVAGARPAYPVAALVLGAAGVSIGFTLDDETVARVIGVGGLAMLLVAFVATTLWFPRSQIRANGMLRTRGLNGWRTIDLGRVDSATVTTTMRPSSDRVQSAPKWDMSVCLRPAGSDPRSNLRDVWVTVASPPMVDDELARFVAVLSRFVRVDVDEAGVAAGTRKRRG